jgi:dihydrofolate synthase/folylpolyglutamate synthase
VVLGETDPELVPIFLEEKPERVWERELDFGCEENTLALGGRLLTLRTPYGSYRDVYLPLHGNYQGDNAVAALVAAESFFEAALAEDVVEEGFASVVMPGRFEVLSHQPLVVIDGAHNPAGADTCATVLADDFDVPGDTFLVCGFLRGRDPAQMLSALRADDAAAVFCCTPPSPRGIPAAEVAAAARAMGCDEVYAADEVEQACNAALVRATGDDAVLVTGSLYVVGAARPHLRQALP